MSQVVAGGVGLVSRRGDAQVLEQVLEDGDGLGSLLAGDRRNGGNINSRHFEQGKVEKETVREKRKNVLGGYLNQEEKAHENCVRNDHAEDALDWPENFYPFFV